MIKYFLIFYLLYLLLVANMSIVEYLNSIFNTKVDESSLKIHQNEVAYCRDDSFVVQVRPGDYLRIQIKHEDLEGSDWLKRVKSVDVEHLFKCATHLLKNTHIRYESTYDVDGYCPSTLTLYYVDPSKDWYAYGQAWDTPTLCTLNDIIGPISLTRFYLLFTSFN